MGPNSAGQRDASIRRGSSSAKNRPSKPDAAPSTRETASTTTPAGLPTRSTSSMNLVVVRSPGGLRHRRPRVAARRRVLSGPFARPRLWQRGGRESTASAHARLFRHRRRGHLQGRQSRQSAALGPCLRRELRVHHRRRRPRLQMRADTSKAATHLPLYHWRSLAELKLPKGCSLVGVEILDEAADLPSFPHPVRAAYVLGPERGASHARACRALPALVRIPLPSPSMLPPPAPSSCMTACARLAASPLAPSPRERNRPPEAPHVQGAPPQTAPAGLTEHSGQRKIKPVCFTPAHELGTGRCTEPFELARRRGAFRHARFCAGRHPPGEVQGLVGLRRRRHAEGLLRRGQAKEINPKNRQARAGLLLHFALAGRQSGERGERQNGLPVRPGRQGHGDDRHRKVRVVHQG